MSEIDRLLQVFYLLNDPDENRPEYTRAQVELICNVLGVSLTDQDYEPVARVLWSVGKRIYEGQE